MPLTGKAKADYQRELMKKRRVKPTNDTSEGPPGVIVPPGTTRGQVAPGHEHYWLRRAGDDVAVCTAFEMQGRIVGGCGQSRKYEGKLLPTSDEHPDLATAIIDSPHYKEIQGKMPVTKGRAPG